MGKYSWHEEPSKEEQRQLVRQVGARLREAREMQGYSQMRAAELLGYENSSKLSKMESGDNSTQMPTWALRQASQVYDVSLDWLLGTTEDAQNSPDSISSDLIALMRCQWADQRRRDQAVIEGTVKRIDKIERHFEQLFHDLAEAKCAMERIKQLNESWQDIRGGLRLAMAIGVAYEGAREVVRHCRHTNKKLVRTLANDHTRTAYFESEGYE